MNLCGAQLMLCCSATHTNMKDRTFIFVWGTLGVHWATGAEYSAFFSLIGWFWHSNSFIGRRYPRWRIFLKQPVARVAVELSVFSYLHIVNSKNVPLATETWQNLKPLHVQLHICYNKLVLCVYICVPIWHLFPMTLFLSNTVERHWKGHIGDTEWTRGVSADVVRIRTVKRPFGVSCLWTFRLQHTSGC